MSDISDQTPRDGVLVRVCALGGGGSFLLVFLFWEMSRRHFKPFILHCRSLHLTMVDDHTLHSNHACNF